MPVLWSVLRAIWQSTSYGVNVLRSVGKEFYFTSPGLVEKGSST